MKIKFLATGIAPEKYEFDGEKVIADGVVYDLSSIKEGDSFIGFENDELFAVRDAERINGELYVTLCQKAPSGHWRGIDEWIDAEDYSPDKLYIKEITVEEMLSDMGYMIQGFVSKTQTSKAPNNAPKIIKRREEI